MGKSFLVDFRSGGHVVPILLSMLSTIALVEMVIPWLEKSVGNRSTSSISPPGNLTNDLTQILLAYLFAAMLIGALTSVSSLAGENTLKSLDRQAIAWVRENTPENSRSLCLAR
jgi:hypothetical protein